MRGDRKAGYNRRRLFYDWLLSFWFNDRAFLSNTPLSPRKSAGFRYIFRLFPGFRLRLHPGLLFCRPLSRAQSTVRLRLTKDINIFLTACGRVKSGLKPAVKNRATHGGEECAARMVKTKADALGIGGQAPICRAVRRTEGERNSIARGTRATAQ